MTPRCSAAAVDAAAAAAMIDSVMPVPLLLQQPQPAVL